MDALTCKKINDKAVWEQHLRAFPESNFLQSWNWGVFHESLGKEVGRLAFFDETKQIVSMVQYILEQSKRGTYLSIPAGPLFHQYNQTTIAPIFSYLREIAINKRCLFIRFRVQQRESEELRVCVQQCGAIPSPMHITADRTLQLNISQPESEILGQMRKSTRYEIKKAEKLGVTTSISTDMQEVHAFFLHQLEVAKRQKFVPFSEIFLTKQFLAFLADHQVALIHSQYGSTLLATAFVIFYHQEAVYHYGISTESSRQYSGAYATQWRAIQEAKKRGCTVYNFWGVAPESETKHRFASLSIFKRGFGGQEIQYLPAQDIPTHPLYIVTRMFEQLRKKRRKL
ncbi:MAG: Methicillin resistance protein [Microgenomates group bacterium GW2011_GWF2_45_18]|nr:MAG: Methicillin resistance protein [Microgenomates group bacterium GW2011_GWF1_44_10]KKU02239.1 MAG: Methicillin resistance protein [Microgenomates group bacterium GW2011_GWF2_45_18]HAU98832.1 hypothetical protein [Candidatus Paceibacterota bacterium]HAX01827.1 hypothetical protein [Candidatus Paceibacterota bacterium]